MALTRTAVAVMRRRYGELADPIMALRDAGKIVRPFGELFVVDKDVTDADGIVRLADELRARQAAKAMRAKKKPAPETPCGGEAAAKTMKGDAMKGGLGSSSAKPSADARDKFTRLTKSCGGVDGHAAHLGGDANALLTSGAASTPPGKAQPLPSGRRVKDDAVSASSALAAGIKPGLQDTIARIAAHEISPAEDTTANAGGSHEVAHQDNQSFELNDVKVPEVARVAPPAILARIAALEARVAASEAKLEAFKATVRAAFVDVVAHLGLEDGR